MEESGRLQQQKEFLIRAAYWAVWGTTGILLVKFVGPALLPFVIAFFIAWALAAPTDFLSERMHVNRKLISVILVVLFYVAVAGLLWLLASRVVSLAQGVTEDVSAFLSDTVIPLLERFSRWVERMLSGTAGKEGMVADAEAVETFAHTGGMLSGVSGKVIDEVSGLAAYLPGVCMNVLLTVIATLFMELEFPGMTGFLYRQIPKRWQKTTEDIRAYTVGTLAKYIRSYALILGMTFAELLVGFLILRVDGAFLIAFIIAVLDILPVLGTGTVLVPWAVIALAADETGTGGGILILYLIITVVRNIVEPKLVGRQMGLSPVVTLPCMILGLKLFGIVGLFALPFGVAFVKSLNDRGVIRLFR